MTFSSDHSVLLLLRKMLFDISLFGLEQQTTSAWRQHHMVLHIVEISSCGGDGIFIAFQPSCHLSPWMKFKYLTERESRLIDRIHLIQFRGIYPVLLSRLSTQRQIIVVVTDIHCVGHRIFFVRRMYLRRLGSRIPLGSVINRRIMEHGKATHRHELLDGVSFSAIRIRNFYRVSNDTEGEIIILTFHTYVSRRCNPYRIGDIRIAHIYAILVFTLTVPTPPAVETTLTKRKFYVLVGYVIGSRVVVIEDAFILMYLLQTGYRIYRISGRTRRMEERLVIRILEITGLRHGQTVIDVTRLAI